MTMNPLPPQAYTKETLVKAYQWLQHQSDSIKEMAKGPDILVSLYLKAKFQGDSALERPSIQNFKNELKSLAGMMGEFETYSAPLTPPSSHSATAATNVTPAMVTASLQNRGTAYAAHASHPMPSSLPPLQTPQAQPPRAQHTPVSENHSAHESISAHAAQAASSAAAFAQPMNSTAGANYQTSTPHPSAHLSPPPRTPSSAPGPAAGPSPAPTRESEMDAKSRAMIHDVKIQLNLSSDQEALRALISIGYAKIKVLLLDK